MTLTLNDPTLFKQHCYINGEWVDGPNQMDVTNPFDQSILGSCPQMDEQMVEKTITAAHKAFNSWRSKTSNERSKCLYEWYELICAHQKDLGVIMTKEQGKPLEESMGEVAYAASFVKWYAEEAKRIYRDTIPAPSSDQRIVVIKSPVGVCSAITPWNFPAAMITRKVAPALAAGCSMVLKPSSLTPFSALALAELSNRAGIPKGVFNVITGNAADIGQTLATHPKIRKLSFTGSTLIGKKLMSLCSGTIKKVSLELGGNAPFIVFEDADLDAAVKGAMVSKFRNTGQTCVCANRFFIHQKVVQSFTQKFKQKVQDLRVTNGMEKGAHQGPLINMNSVVKLETLLKDAIKKGAEIVTGGNRHPLGGTFFEPTILENITEEMAIFHEEIFGPVAPIMTFHDEDAVIDLANKTPYGLAAYFYSQNMGRIWRTSEALDYGIIGVNTGLISTEVAPFGGIKESGIGREGSKYGLDEYLELKYISMAGVQR